MTAILALFATFTFVLSIPLLLFNLEGMSRKQVEINKEKETLKATLDEALLNGTDEQIDAAQKAYNEKNAASCSTCVVNCFSLLMGTITAIFVRIFELSIIITSLSMNVGIPVIGYVALGAFALSFIWTFFIQSKLSDKHRASDEAVGNTYIPRTNFVGKALFFTADLYLLYIVLVIIGLL